jgi:hypothetical protein
MRSVIVACGVLASSALLPASVLALEPRQCLPLAEMNAALKAEGQRTLIIGDRKAVNDAPDRASGVRVTRYANAVTSNADGTLGYQIEGDRPRAQPSTSMCVRAKLARVRLLDARKAGVQTAALLGGAFDAEVRDKEKIGTRPMLIADTMQTGPDGSVRTGLPMIVFGNVAGRSASIYARLANGDPAFLVLMGDTDYTPEALRRLAQ